MKRSAFAAFLGLLAVLAGLALPLGAPSRALAGESAEPPAGAVRFTGKVTVTRRELGVPAAATFAVPGGKTYALVMDERGRSLGSVMHGQTADIHGVAEGDNLRVLGYVDERVNAGHEFWRRMRCLACVVLPATINAATPPDLKGAAEVAGRPWDFKRQFTAWTRDGKFLWVAADNELLQFDLAAKKLAKSYGRAEGLPDGLVHQLVSDGARLWIVHRKGVSVLPVGGDRIQNSRIAAGSRFVRAFSPAADDFYFLADTGTFCAGGADKDRRTEFPAMPTAARFAKAVEAGIWPPHWERRTAHFVTDPVLVGGRLYVGSFGDIYELDLGAGKWTKVAENGYAQTASGGKLWFLTPKGLGEYDQIGRAHV